MTMRRYSAWALAAIALAGFAAPAWAEIVDRVMAVVGTQIVTLSDVRAAETFGLVPPAALAASGGDVLAYLVDRQLMLSEVERYSAPEPEGPAVERRMTQIRESFSTAAQFEQALARTAMSEARLRNVVGDTLRVEAYLDQRFGIAAQPTPEEVQRYYREHPAEFTQNGRLAPFEDVQQVAQQRAAAERRRALIADWLDRLRRRGPASALPGR
jgi:hypothetical protein